MNDNSVAVFGGGVAGLTVAHELAERGFRVTVYEPRRIFGGKARSLPVPGSGRDGRKPLPGEHGFRLFPAFYRHVPDTMARIPYGSNRGGVLDNLVSVERTLFASAGQRPLRFPVHAPRNAMDIASWTASMVDAMEAWIPAADCVFFIHRMLVLMTSCDRRRETQFDDISWWQYMDAGRRSANYQRYLAGGLTRSLVAMRAQEGSARTLGMILQALMVDSIAPGRSSDRVLNGPTNTVWIDPWISHLRTLGVSFQRASLVHFRLAGNCIGGAIVKNTTGKREVSAGEYVLAVPYEVADRILTDEVRVAAPSLCGLHHLRSEWMNGIQYYLDRDVSLVDGHCIFVDSPWALTAISQRQFWTGVQLSDLGRGDVRGILSVDISDWNTPGILYGRAARRCSAAEISREVWAQLKMHLNVGGVEVLHDAAIVKWFLDPSLTFRRRKEPFNTEPLFINTVGSLKHRPRAQTEIDNLSMAGDYVRTQTDLATMESASEAGRQAANGILARSGAHYSRANVWSLPEPEALGPLRALDARRFEHGFAHRWYDGKADTVREAIANRFSQLTEDVGQLWSASKDHRIPTVLASVNDDSAATPQLRLPDERLDPFFRKHPTEGFTTVGQSLTRVPLPFHAYQADALVIYGMASVAVMQKMLHATGLHPVTATPKKGYASLWIIQYADTSCGPYSEVVLNLAVHRAPKVCQWVCEYSSMAASLDPENKVFTVQLLLNRRLPIDYGREIYGLDKRLAEIEIVRSMGIKRFCCAETDRRPIVSGRVREEAGRFEQAGAVAGIARAVGVRRFTRDFLSALRGEPANGIMVTRDIRCGNGNATSEIIAQYKLTPSLLRWGPLEELTIAAGSSFGRMLIDLAFDPQVYCYDHSMKGVLRAGSVDSRDVGSRSISYEAGIDG